MKEPRQILPATLTVLGAALLAWVLYDATQLTAALGLAARVDEAFVAVTALVLGVGSCVGSVVLSNRRTIPRGGR